MKIQHLSNTMMKNYSFSVQNNREKSLNNICSKKEKENLSRKNILSFGNSVNNCKFASFGILQDMSENYDTVFNVKDYFVFHPATSNQDEHIMHSFQWKFKNNNVQGCFLANQNDFAVMLKNHPENISNFEVITDDNSNFISFCKKNVKYNLQYNKNSKTLVKASAQTILKNENSPFERVEIKTSQKNPNSYIVHYKFIHTKQGISYIEDSYMHFESNSEIPAVSYTNKHIYYTHTGKKFSQNFANKFDSDGNAKAAPIPFYSLI